MKQQINYVTVKQKGANKMDFYASKIIELPEMTLENMGQYAHYIEYLYLCFCNELYDLKEDAGEDKDLEKLYRYLALIRELLSEAAQRTRATVENRKMKEAVA